MLDQKNLKRVVELNKLSVDLKKLLESIIGDNGHTNDNKYLRMLEKSDEVIRAIMDDIQEEKADVRFRLFGEIRH